MSCSLPTGTQFNVRTMALNHPAGVTTPSNRVGAQPPSVNPFSVRSPYGPIESAYQSCNNIIPMALGPIDKVVGACAQIHQNSGMCWGAFPSQWVDVAENDLASCLYQENVGTKTFPNRTALMSYQQDPAKGLAYWGAQNPRIDAEQKGCLPTEKWGPCSSYGSYSAAPNAALSCGVVGNTLMGDSTSPWCVTASKYSAPYLS